MYTSGTSKLNKKERQELILNLCRAFSVLRSPQEAADALTDLFTPKEVETIAKRLRIAEFLIKGDNYDDIKSNLKVGYSTIARVNTWLNLSGEGFKIMFQRKKKSPRPVPLEERYDPYSWHNIKRRYSMRFWPELLLEEIINHSDRKEKEKIWKVMEKLDMKKRRFSGKENKILYESFLSKIQK